mgnify:CR=1 FL=1
MITRLQTSLIAVKELGVKSPLREAKLTKAEIREYSKELGLPTWDKQSFGLSVLQVCLWRDHQ